MDVGMMMIFSSYGWEEGSDGQMWEEELRLAEIAADSGFDCLWSAEHHFNDYSFVPDNLHLMTHLAAKYPNIDVGTAAVILPWHDPLRVAEDAAVLDLLSNGRLRLGFGRGLARREFETFGISMDESRDNLGIHLSIEPRFLASRRFSRKTGLELLPVGAYGLE